jgi:hypothetical protein
MLCLLAALLLVSTCSCRPPPVQDGHVRGFWFQIHRGLQVLGFVLAVAGFILVWAVFSFGSRADTSPRYPAHRGLGIATMAMVVVQAGTGMVRPGLGHKKRGAWRRLHQGWGWLATMLGKRFFIAR